MARKLLSATPVMDQGRRRSTSYDGRLQRSQAARLLNLELQIPLDHLPETQIHEHCPVIKIISNLREIGDVPKLQLFRLQCSPEQIGLAVWSAADSAFREATSVRRLATKLPSRTKRSTRVRQFAHEVCAAKSPGSPAQGVARTVRWEAAGSFLWELLQLGLNQPASAGRRGWPLAKEH